MLEALDKLAAQKHTTTSGLVWEYMNRELYIEGSRKDIDFIPASNEPSAVLARAFGECREGQIPRCLQRCKFDTTLLAAGYLIARLIRQEITAVNHVQ